MLRRRYIAFCLRTTRESPTSILPGAAIARQRLAKQNHAFLNQPSPRPAALRDIESSNFEVRPNWHVVPSQHLAAVPRCKYPVSRRAYVPTLVSTPLSGTATRCDTAPHATETHTGAALCRLTPSPELRPRRSTPSVDGSVSEQSWLPQSHISPSSTMPFPHTSERIGRKQNLSLT